MVRVSSGYEVELGFSFFASSIACPVRHGMSLVLLTCVRWDEPTEPLHGLLWFYLLVVVMLVTPTIFLFFVERVAKYKCRNVQTIV
jgi:hypothetical protein